MDATAHDDEQQQPMARKMSRQPTFLKRYSHEVGGLVGVGRGFIDKEKYLKGTCAMHPSLCGYIPSHKMKHTITHTHTHTHNHTHTLSLTPTLV